MRPLKTYFGMYMKEYLRETRRNLYIYLGIGERSDTIFKVSTDIPIFDARPIIIPTIPLQVLEPFLEAFVRTSSSIIRYGVRSKKL